MVKIINHTIILHALYELPDEQEEFALLVEELNAAVEPNGLHIRRVEWVYGTQETDCGDAPNCVSTDTQFPTTEGTLHFRLSGDIDTREVQFVLLLQVSLNALYRDMLSVDEFSNLVVFQKPLLSLKRLPFVRNTSLYRKIMENVRQAEEKDYSMDVLLENFFRSESREQPQEENTCEAHKRKKVALELRTLTALEAALTDVALVVVRMSRPSACPRWKKAEEHFWNGEYETAIEVLNLPKIKTELRKATHDGDRMTGESLIGEAMLRLRLLQVDKPEWEGRDAWIREIVSIYKTCISCGRSCLPKMALTGLMTEYADFLDKIGQDRRSWLVYERVIPLWRTLAEENPGTYLPELARALHHYALLLAYSYMLITTDPTGEECYDDVFRNNTSEALFQEVTDIYRRLAEDYPDAVLPLWAKATFHYAALLLNLYFAQRAFQTFSESLDLYRILAERHPECYEPLLTKMGNDVTERILSYNSYFEDESAAEEIQSLLSEAEHEHPDAQFQLGERYQHGNGVIRDYDEAEKWYARAAKNGYMEAQRCMGHNYLAATLGRKDIAAAEKWFRKAAMQGDEQSQIELAKICMDKGNQHAFDEALYWLHEAAGKEEDGEACYLLGQCCENGTGVPQSYEQAAFWYQKGSEDFGNLYCLYRLGLLYHYGKGVPQDFDKALSCYEEVRTWGFNFPNVRKQIKILIEEMKETL